MHNKRLLVWVGSAVLFGAVVVKASGATVVAVSDSFVETSQPNTAFGPGLSYTLMAPGDYRLYQFLPPVLPVGQQISPLNISITEHAEDPEPQSTNGTTIMLMGTSLATGATYSQVLANEIPLGFVTLSLDPNNTTNMLESYSGVGVYTGLQDIENGTVKSFVMPYVPGFTATEIDGVGSGATEFITYGTIVPEPGPWVFMLIGITFILTHRLTTRSSERRLAIGSFL